MSVGTSLAAPLTIAFDLNYRALLAAWAVVALVFGVIIGRLLFGRGDARD